MHAFAVQTSMALCDCRNCIALLSIKLQEHLFMNKFKAFSLIGLVMLSSGCAEDLKNLQQFNSSLSTLAAGGQPRPAFFGDQATPIFSQNVMSPNIVDAFQSKLTPPSNNGAISANWTSAKPLVEKVVGLGACGVGPYANNGGQDEIEAWKSLGRWTDPDVKNPLVSGSFPLAIWHTQYHPKSSCMSILRIDKWAKPSRNTLAFRVQFVSDASDETVYINYLFKILDDGTWVFNLASR
jgi:hypothetical protein